MKHLQRMFRVSAAATLLSALELPLYAQTFDQDYLATRARLVQRLDRLPDKCLAADKPDAEAQAIAADLRTRLENRIGSPPASIAVKPGGASPTWSCAELGDLHRVDALVYEMSDGSGIVVRTTPGLLRAWAERQRQGESVDDPPGQWVDGLPRNGEWYIWAAMSGAVGIVAAEIPVRPLKSGTHALAYLAGNSQGFFAGQPPGLLLIIVTNGDRVSFAWTPVNMFQSGLACRSQLAPFDLAPLVPATDWAKRREARQVYANCWSAALQAAPGRIGLNTRAQKLVEALE